MKSTNNILVNVEDLRIAFRNTKKLNEVVHGVSFQVKSNEILGIVGESGSGKSVTALALMGLLPKKNCVITGKLTYRDLDLLKISNKQWQEIRSNKIAKIGRASCRERAKSTGRSAAADRQEREMTA